MPMPSAGIRLRKAGTATVLALSFTLGLQIAALAAAQSGWDVGQKCATTYPADGSDNDNLNACVDGGCRTLHGQDDPTGMAECVAKADVVIKAFQDAYDATGEP